MSWLNKLKVAIVNQNVEEAYQLIINIPKDELQTQEDLLNAKEFIHQGIKLLENEQQKIHQQMIQIKNAQKFLDS